jgi:4-hydroxybenzoate polyprenyltransferase
MFEMIKQYCYLMRLHKPVGILLLLWPTLWGLWLATSGHPSRKLLSIFILGVIIMRSAGCIINDFADRNFDPHVLRTKDRPLATKKIKTSMAGLLFSILCACAFILVLQLNYLTIKLSIIAVLLTIIYPFLKRITHLPQIGLGFAFAWGVLMAFTATQNTIPTSAWLIFSAAIIWPIMYDTLYAMADKNDDIKIGVKSTAILFQDCDKVFIAILQSLFIVLLLLMGWQQPLKWYFYLSLTISTILFVYQQYLIKERKPTKCLQAFLNNQWVGAIIFMGIAASYIC